MVTPNERGILEIAAEQGKASFGRLSARMGLSTQIISLTCNSLKGRGYVELPRPGIITPTTKGLHAVGKRPLLWSFPYH